MPTLNLHICSGRWTTVIYWKISDFGDFCHTIVRCSFFRIDINTCVSGGKCPRIAKVAIFIGVIRLTFLHWMSRDNMEMLQMCKIAGNIHFPPLSRANEGWKKKNDGEWRKKIITFAWYILHRYRPWMTLNDSRFNYPFIIGFYSPTFAFNSRKRRKTFFFVRCE